MAHVYIGLGSNQDGPCSQIIKAILELTQVPQTRVVAVSDLYRSPPMGPQDQPWYVNGVARLTTTLSPLHLLEQTQAIERRMGRIATRRWGPRVIDLDLLLYDQQIITSDLLQLPHPGLRERNFVLIPLTTLAPNLHLPCGTAIAELAALVGQGTLERI